jgi:S1-C subfamily serine protease
MTTSVLIELSQGLTALAAGAGAYVATVSSKDGEAVNGVLWKPNAVVVSEQTLGAASEYEVRVGEKSVSAELAGRDPGTNVAVLRLKEEIPLALPPFAVPSVAALAVVVGRGEDVSARLAVVRGVGPAWQSLAGGTIDQRILLDRTFGPSEDGAAVIGADGALFGIATLGARRQTLVIPAATVERAVIMLLEKGSVERGWLGVALHPVAIPESLRPQSSQRVGLMVMEVMAGSPAEKAGVVAGDILLSAGGTPATRPRHIARQLGANSVGRRLALTIARAGAIVSSEATIEARKSA